MKKAYSYIRYSSPQQAKGDSFRRQFSATQAYCDKNRYELASEALKSILSQLNEKPVY
jgi:DNA invertase Pin-like site-specific DNA recombinase